MTKEELMALLRDPDQTGQSVDELNRLIEENPYFHTGHKLYIKGLQQSDTTQMALQLGKTALSVRDRGVLYNYMNRPSSFRQQPSSLPHDRETLTPFVPGNTFVSPEAGIRHFQDVQPEPSFPQQNPLNTGGGWQDAEEQISVEEKSMSTQQLMDIVRQQLDQIDSSQKTEENPPPSEVAANPIDVTTDVVSGNSVEAMSNAEATTDIVDTVNDVVETGLTILKNPDVEIRSEYSEEQLIADLIRSAPVSPDVTFSDDTTVAKRNLKSDDLIDTFLKSNPKIIPDENRTYQVDLTESMQENQDIATETLADIYATQGHKNKAIEIYEQLILKYPEKHIYFAAQIERLKE